MRFSLIVASIAVAISLTCVQDVSAKGARLNRRKINAAVEKRAPAPACDPATNPNCPKPVDIFSAVGFAGVDLSNPAGLVPAVALPNAGTTVTGLTSGTVGSVTGALPGTQPQGGAD